MDFSLLGDVAARHNDHPLRLGGGQQRAVLAVLLLEPNAVVRRTEIVRLAWGTGPDVPRTADSLVADYVSRLRTIFRNAGAGAEVELIAYEPGYLIKVAEEAIDWHQFRRLADRAQAAQDAADIDAAAQLLRDGLALWRGPGPPLANVGSALDPVRKQMDKHRLAAAEALAAIELARGQPDRVVHLLADLAQHSPTRERLAALLIRALHATGRQDEAVAVYLRSRRHLRNELGLDPTEVLEDAYQALLSGHPSLGPPAAAPSAGPAQLPLDTSNFTGRTEELVELLALVPSNSTEPTGERGPIEPVTTTEPGSSTPGTGVICVVDGMAGVGKTALAVHAAHLMARWFPDGQLFLDLHGYTANVPRIESAEALDRLLRTIGVAGEKIPQHPDDRAALYRDRLAGRQMLILLDNAHSADQVRPLLPAAAGCLVLVTSRRRLAALDDAHSLSLETLPAADAVTLFGRVAGADRVSGHHEVVERIADLCGGLPMAIRIVAARLRNHPAWRPSQVADRLADAHDQPSELDDGERSIIAAFRLSYDDLSGDQRRMFLLLGLVPGRDVDAYAAAALLDSLLNQAARLLQELLDAHLLDQQVEGRYHFHDLMRSYAAQLATVEDSRLDRRAALARLLDYQLHTASVAMDVLFPHERDRRPRAPIPSAPVPAVSDHAPARAWLDTERINLIAAAGDASGYGWTDHTRRLDAMLYRYLVNGGHYADALELHQHALRAARDQRDRAGEGTALDHLGNTYRRLGRYQEALSHFRQALATFREVGDQVGEAITLTDLGVVLGLHGDFNEALQQLHLALVLHRQVGSRANEANTLACLGNVHLFGGDYDLAGDYYRQALSISAEIGDRAGEGASLTNLGDAHERRGRHDLALRHHRQALSIFAEIGDRAGEGTALTNLGEVHERRGRHDLALQHHRQALGIFRAIHHRPGQGEALSHLGSTHAALRHYGDSIDNYERGLVVAREMGDRTLETIALNGLGATLREVGRSAQALESHQSALTLARRHGNRYELARALEGIAELQFAAGERRAAYRNWQDALTLYADLKVPEAHRLRVRLQQLEPLS